MHLLGHHCIPSIVLQSNAKYIWFSHFHLTSCVEPHFNPKTGRLLCCRGPGGEKSSPSRRRWVNIGSTPLGILGCDGKTAWNVRDRNPIGVKYWDSMQYNRAPRRWQGLEFNYIPYNIVITLIDATWGVIRSGLGSSRGIYLIITTTQVIDNWL